MCIRDSNITVAPILAHNTAVALPIPDDAPVINIVFPDNVKSESIIIIMLIAVSYTHLDVYKRQEEYKLFL